MMKNKNSEKPYTELRARIYLYYATMADFAEAMGCSEQTLSGRLNNKTSWRMPDITKACNLLSIEDVDIPRYFLT